MKKKMFFIFILLFTTMASAWAEGERETLERVAAELGSRQVEFSTVTEELGLFQSRLEFHGCAVEWQDSRPEGGYVHCRALYEDKYFRATGEVNIDHEEGKLLLHLRWEDGSSYLVKLEVELIRAPGNATWRGKGDLTAHYRRKIWHNNYWQVDLHGKTSF